MSSELRFDDRVAIVTGAGRGLGREYALALAARGARVVVNDLGASLDGDGSDPGPAAAVAQEIIDAGGEAVANASSVTTPEGAESIAADALDRFGRIDIVINNAGNMDPGALPELPLEMVQRHLDIHALGAFNVTRAAWPTLTERGYGRVMLTASIGLYGGSFLISYSTAKGASVSLGRSLADAGTGHGIKVNLIAPGGRDTDGHRPRLPGQVRAASAGSGRAAGPGPWSEPGGADGARAGARILPGQWRGDVGGAGPVRPRIHRRDARDHRPRPDRRGRARSLG